MQRFSLFFKSNFVEAKLCASTTKTIENQSGGGGLTYMKDRKFKPFNFRYLTINFFFKKALKICKKRAEFSADFLHNFSAFFPKLSIATIRAKWEEFQESMAQWIE